MAAREGTMHPQFRIDFMHDREREIQANAHRASLLARAPVRAVVSYEAVSLRLCSVNDDAAFERLAALEGRPVPSGRFVLAEVDGEIVAALPLSGGAPLADPFRQTTHLMPLLRLRAAQLEPSQSRARIDTAKAIAARVLHPAR